MERSELEKLGLDKANIDKIMTLNGVDIEKGKKQAQSLQKQLDEANAQAKNYKDSISNFDTKVKDLEGKLSTNKDASEQLAEFKKNLKSDQEASKKAFEAEKSNLAKSYEIKLAAQAAHAYDAGIVASQIDADKVSIGSDGKAIGIQDQLKAVKEAKPFLFEPDKQKPSGSSAPNGNPAAGSQGGSEADAFKAALGIVDPSKK